MTQTPSEPTLRVPTSAEVRDELEALVLADLLGPVGGPEEEVVEDRVSERYLVGMLAPRRTAVHPDTHDPVAFAEGGSGDDEPEPAAPATRTFFQSSAGFTCCVDGGATELVATASWGHYTRTAAATPEPEGGQQLVWRRRPAGGSVRISLVEGEFRADPPDPEQPEVVVRGRARRAAGQWLVTIFLANEQPEPSIRRDERWLFQVELALAAPDGAPVFRQPPVIETP